MQRDANDVLIEEGPDALRDEIDAATPYVPPEETPKRRGGHQKKAAPKSDASEPSALHYEPGSIDGDALLRRVLELLRRFIIYPSEHAAIAHVLWIAHAYRMDAWENTPRLLFTSYQPGSGKSRCLEITAHLVPRPMEAFNVSAAYLIRKVAGSESALPTILYDEIDALFGAGRASEKSEEVRAVINAGHRRGAKIGRCRLSEDGVETEELPAYCAMALAGLDRKLPDTITSRSIIIIIKRRAAHEIVEAFRPRLVRAEAKMLRDALEAWTQAIQTPADGVFPEMPEGVRDREADVWEAPLAIADAAGGEWPSLAAASARYFVERRSDARPSLGIQLLKDIKSVFESEKNSKGGEVKELATVILLSRLNDREESPWGDLKGKPLDARALARMLRPFEVKPTTLRTGSSTPKGYKREDFEDAWGRYV